MTIDQVSPGADRPEGKAPDATTRPVASGATSSAGPAVGGHPGPAGRTCEIDGCTEVATRGCWSCFRFECNPHRGTDPCACTWCRTALERCGCLTGCSRCALDALAPPDEPGIPVPVRIGA